MLGESCAEVGLPATAERFTEALRATLSAKAAEVDAGYPDNADLAIDEVTGVPSLKRRQGKDRSASALGLRRRSKSGCPSGRCSRSSLAPRTGSSGGGTSGPRRAQTRSSRPAVALRADHVHLRQPARPGAGRAAHARRLRARAGRHRNRHFTIEKLNRAIADVINAYLDLDLARFGGTPRRSPPTARRWTR